VLAGRQRSLDDLAVQGIGDGDDHRVDVGSVDHGTPVGGGALETKPGGGVDRERLVRVRDRDQAHRRHVGVEDGGGVAVGVGVCAADHAGADQRYADGVRSHGNLSGGRGFKAL
jgi:hypothetical protein